MNNEEIKALLRELSDSADAAGRSRTVKITLDKKPEPEPEPEPEPRESAAHRKETAGREMPERPKKKHKPEKGQEPERTQKQGRPKKQSGPKIQDSPEKADKPEIREKPDRPEEAAEEEKPVRPRGKKRPAAEVEPVMFETDADVFRQDLLGDAPVFTLPKWVRGIHRKGKDEADVRLLPDGAPPDDSAPLDNRAQADNTTSSDDRVQEDDEAPADDGARPEELPPQENEQQTDEKEDVRKKKPGFFSRLRRRGIHTREIILLAAGVILLALVAFLLVRFFLSGKKSEHVAAQEGLTVTVEDEPKEWVRSAPVTLGIRASSAILDVRVNGQEINFSGGKRTTVTVQAESPTLHIEVDTEEKTLNATAEIPMIDAEDPVVTVSVENGMATLDAVDAESGLSGVWYGSVEGFSDVPSYQPYTGAFRIDTLKRYYFFAKDNAGNMTNPVETTMIPAQGLQVSKTQLTLFPNESSNLQITALPEGSFVNGFRITSSDPRVASVDRNGVITALSNGQTVIEAEADGLPSVSCNVNVQSQAEITISAVGDVTMGDDVNFSQSNSFSTVYSMYGASHFFENVRDIFKADDITFANLEGTLTDRGERENKQFAFRGSPSYTDILLDGSVEVVTLANNHSRDYGDISREDTEKYLTEAGIDYCLGDRVVIREQGGVKVALIGIYVLDEGAARESQVRNTIENAKEQDADIIVMAFHWGSENSYVPDAVQQSLAHIAIDCGADLVVGHHPHVLEGIEVYNGKYIVYSLGNFCFGGNSNPSDKDTMIFQQTFRVEAGGNITGTSIHIIPCSISSDAGWNNYQPTPASGDEAVRIRDKIKEMSLQIGTDLGDGVF